MQEVGREVIYSQGCFSRVRIWYAGHIKGINGIFTHGWQGEDQTMVQKDIIVPVVVFEIKEATDDLRARRREDPTSAEVFSEAAA